MYLLSDVGGLTGVANTLSSISVPPDVIDDIIKVLDVESASLKDGKPTEVSSTVFGGRFSGENLAHHTRLAHEHLSNSVIEVVASLQGTGEAVEQFHKELQGVDVDAHAATTSLLHRTQHAVNQMDDDRHTPPSVPTKGNKP